MPASIQDLPHEILDAIVAYLPTAKAVRDLGRVNKVLQFYVENEGWAVFTRARFPWIDQAPTQPWKVLARSLTTTSRAWDRRAFVVHETLPKGSITQYPGIIELAGWKKPTGQTIGYAPHMDAYEHSTHASDNVDVLAFTTGASFCIRRKREYVRGGRKLGEEVKWSVYQLRHAASGFDDFTSIHLLRPHVTGTSVTHEVIAGSVNGKLQHIRVPSVDDTNHSSIPKDSAVLSSFATKERNFAIMDRVQATSLLQEEGRLPLLAAALGNSKLALYKVDSSKQEIRASTTYDFKTTEVTHAAFAARTSRIWTVTQLSEQYLAAGVGQSPAPVQLCNILPTGIDAASIRGFHFSDESGKSLSLASVFRILPLSGDSRTFLSGSYDGLVRLHDLRSSKDVETYYTAPHGDLAISSLLMRGHQTLMAGTVRHEMVCIFDLRNRQGQYYYTDASRRQPTLKPVEARYSVFMTPREGRRASDGSIYSMAASSLSSPTVYMGIQNSVLELSATELSHVHPDVLYFSKWKPQGRKKQKTKSDEWYGWKDVQIRSVALYEGEKLYKQKLHGSQPACDDRLDDRWTTS